MDNVKRESPLFLRKMSRNRSLVVLNVDTFLSLFAGGLYLCLQSQIWERSWHLNLEADCADKKRQDKARRETRTQKQTIRKLSWSALVSGAAQCPSVLNLSTNVKLLKLWKQVYWVSIHASVSVLKYQLTIDVLFFSSSCPTRPHHPVNLISFIGPSLKNVFFFQIKRFALLTMASSKYPSNVIRFDVGRHLKKSLLSYSTYHVNVFYTLETKKRYPLLLEFACLI